MALSINNNLPSLQADGQIRNRTNNLRRNFEALSSGSRVTRASTDPAGLAIAVQLTSGAQVADVGTRNISDAVSAANIAEGAVGSASDIATRLAELAQQASNGTVSSQQRTALNNEFQQLRQELDRIAETTEFNGQPLLNGSASIGVQVGGDGSANSQLRVSLPQVSSSGLGLESDLLSQENAEAALAEAKAAINTLAESKGSIGSSVSRLDTALENLRSSAVNAREAASQIADADIAQQAAELTANRIGLQSSVGIKAQANIQPEIAFKLLNS